MFGRSLLPHQAVACCVLLCFTSGLVAGDGETPPSELTAEQVLQRMAEAYANCETYQDAGEVTVSVDVGFGKRTTAKPFTTAFVRPDRFRFESQDPTLGDPPARHIVWKNGDEVRRWHDFIPPQDKEVQSLSTALNNAVIDSMAVSFRVPSLLLPEEVEGQRIDRISDPKRREDAEQDGLACFCIEGVYDDLSMVVWIDQEQFLIRRLDTRNNNPKYKSSGGATTTYHPIINEEVPEQKLQYVPSEDDQDESQEPDPEQ